RCRLFCRHCRLGGVGENDIDLALNKLGRELGIVLGASLTPAILDGHGAAFHPAELAQPPHKRVDPSALSDRAAAAEIADGRQLALLRACRERPRRRCAADECDELAAFHARAHSITSSASCWSCSGTSRPSALAVLRLITNSYLIGCWNGSSPGFS